MRINVKEITIEAFEELIYDKYIHLFNADEQRDWNTIKVAYNNELEKFYAIYDENKMIGFFIIEKIDNYPYYLDYFAIFKEYQSNGYGSMSLHRLLSDIIKEDGLLGEIETVTDKDKITISRWKFYERIGFKKLDNVNFYFNNNIFDLIIYPHDYKIDGDELANILLNYYKINIGDEDTKKLCKIIK